MAFTRFQDHAADARVQRQLGQFVAHARQFVDFVHGPQFTQQGIAVGNGLFGRRFQEREVFDVAQAQAFHAQDHRGQAAAQDLRVGEARAAVELDFAVQTDADAVGHPSATAGALIGSRLADGFHLQLFHLVAVAVALDPGLPAVDDVADAGHRQRGLGHVGGQDDAPPVAAAEHPVLLGLRQAGIEGQDLGLRAAPMLLRQVLAQVVGGLADFALARQEHQNVACPAVAPELVHRIGDGVVQVKVLAFLEGTPALFNREEPARHGDDRRRTVARGKVLRKAVGIDGG